MELTFSVKKIDGIDMAFPICEPGHELFKLIKISSMPVADLYQLSKIGFNIFLHYSHTLHPLAAKEADSALSNL